MEINQSRNAVNRRRWLIEADMSCTSNTKNLYIDSSIWLDLAFIICAKLHNCLSWDFAIGDIDILLRNVDMVEKMVVHVVVVGLSIIVLDWVVLVEIEGHHIFEAQLSWTIKTNQLLIDLNWSATGCKAKHKDLSSIVLLLDCIFNNLGDSHRSLTWCWKEVRCYLLYQGEAWKLGKVAACFFHRHTFLKFKHHPNTV